MIDPEYLHSPASPLMRGDLLDRRYQVDHSLGQGGFGRTYIARDTRRPGTPTCVVKQLYPASSKPSFLQDAQRLFKREAATLEQLGHHNQIPTLLADFEENQEFYLVQEFIKGHPLSDELQSGHGWPESRVIEMLREVLEILEFVHAHKVIHRDIKPDNIIRRDRDEKLVLIDFGIVKQVQTELAASPVQPSMTMSIGTRGYMPNEQANGTPRKNSDIYALGIIGIQALTGLNPTQFRKDPDTSEILWQQQVQVSAELADVLNKMVCYHFKDRYQSVAEALHDLQQLTQLDPLTRRANSSELPKTEIAPKIVPLPLPPAPPEPQPTLKPFAPDPPPLPNQSSEGLDLSTEPFPREQTRSGEQRTGRRRLLRRLLSSVNGSTSQTISLLIGASSIAVGITIFSIVIVNLSPRDGKLSTPTLTVPQAEFLVSTHTGSFMISSVAFSSDGKTLVSGSLDNTNTVEIWDRKTEKSIQTLSDHSGWVYSVAVSPDGRTFASGSEDHTIKIWDLKTGKPLYTLRDHSSSVLSAAFSPNGQLLASGSKDRTIKIWDLKTRKLLKTLSGYTAGFSSVDISADGKAVAGGSEDNTIKIWSLKTGGEPEQTSKRKQTGERKQTSEREQTGELELELLYTLRGHSGQVNSVAFSPVDSTILASGSRDNTIKIWDLDAGEELLRFEHLDSVQSVAISPDGQTLASGSKDKTVKIWNLCTGERIGTFFHEGSVESVAFSRNGQILASGSRDNTIKIWRVPKPEPSTQIFSRVCSTPVS